MTSRAFNHDVSAAKRAAESGPVTITEHGRRSHVLMTAETYDRLVGASELVGDRLFMKDGADVELDLPLRGDGSSIGRRVPDFA